MYPLEHHEENLSLPGSITTFYFSSGKIPLMDKGEGANVMPKAHHLTTGELGPKMYGTCLAAWEVHSVTAEEENSKKSISPTKLALVLPLLRIIPLDVDQNGEPVMNKCKQATTMAAGRAAGATPSAPSRSHPSQAQQACPSPTSFGA